MEDIDKYSKFSKNDLNNLIEEAKESKILIKNS